jgi:hypothetical protein
VGQVGRRRRRRWPYVLLAVAILVAAILVVLDFVAKDATEAAVADNAKSSTHAQSAHVSISSFPFLWDVAVGGRLDRIDITADQVPVGPLHLDEIGVDAKGVHFDQHKLLVDRQVDITAVNQATITVVAQLSSLESTIAGTLGVRVTSPSPGQIAISALGRTVTTIDLTRIPLVPRCPLTVSHTGTTTYTFSCTVAPVPASVLDALSKARAVAS